MDRFHAVPDVPARVASWAEWLYFNGGSGEARFYLTFLVGPPRPGGRRVAGVRLQLDRGGRVVSYGEGVEVDEAEAAGRRARPRDRTAAVSGSKACAIGSRSTCPAWARRAAGAPSRVKGELTLDAFPGRSLPPLMIRGARGWLSGLRGAGDVGRRSVAISTPAASASRWTAAPAITITTGASGKACPGSGARSSTAGCRSSTGACGRRPTPPIRSASPGSSPRSGRRARSGTPPTSRSTRRTIRRRAARAASSCADADRPSTSPWHLSVEDAVATRASAVLVRRGHGPPAAARALPGRGQGRRSAHPVRGARLGGDVPRRPRFWALICSHHSWAGLYLYAPPPTRYASASTQEARWRAWSRTCVTRRAGWPGRRGSPRSR